MRFEAVIFDLDGTLLDSMDVWEQIDICFLQKHGLSVPAYYVAEICVRSFAEAAQYTIDLFGLSEKSENIIREWRFFLNFGYRQQKL
jgi:beta-phosphoglucomutase-like phosphatase (HAD superfamily)